MAHLVQNSKVKKMIYNEVSILLCPCHIAALSRGSHRGNSLYKQTRLDRNICSFFLTFFLAQWLTYLLFHTSGCMCVFLAY